MDFDEAFDELWLVAYQMAFQILGTRAEAEEIAQETMIKAAARWRRVEDHARPWAGRVAANHAIDQLRRRGRRRSVEQTGTAASPASDRTVERLDLQRALLQLPRRQRDVLVLRYVLDLTEAEVARELGLSVAAVKSHAHRAITALRAHYGVVPVAARREEQHGV